MKFKTQVKMQSNPDFHIDANIDPFGFKTSAKGSFESSVSSIAFNVDEFPIRLAIPFLKRNGKLPVVASIGGFKIKLSPFHIKVEEAAVELEGLLGTKGITGKMDGKVGCETKMDMVGKLAGAEGTFKIIPGDEDFEEVESS